METVELAGYFDDLLSKDDKIRFHAFNEMLSMTDREVSWTYEWYDRIIKLLDSKNSYHRVTGIMLLCNLAKSDPEGRINSILQHILSFTRDEKFVTCRKCIQNIWKIAVINKKNEKAVVDHLVERYKTCENEKHYNLIRQDILYSIMKTGKEAGNSKLLDIANTLVDEESIEAYRRSYLTVLKSAGLSV